MRQRRWDLDPTTLKLRRAVEGVILGLGPDYAEASSGRGCEDVRMRKYGDDVLKARRRIVKYLAFRFEIFGNSSGSF